MKTTWFFVWTGKDSVVSQLELHNKTWEEAREIALGWGWRPKKWYNPRTWSSMVIQG